MAVTFWVGFAASVKAPDIDSITLQQPGEENRNVSGLEIDLLDMLEGEEARDVIERDRNGSEGYVHRLVSVALNAMRIVGGLKTITPVTVPTNNMVQFPSPEYPLFPDYIWTKFTKFEYTIGDNGFAN